MRFLPEIKIILSRESASPLEGRKVEVATNHELLYCSWHQFAKIRAKFKEKFNQEDLPGAEDHTDGEVRALFDYDLFLLKATPDQRDWLNERCVFPDNILQPFHTPANNTNGTHPAHDSGCAGGVQPERPSSIH